MHRILAVACLWAQASLALAQPTAKVISFHGYADCIELNNSTTRVVLGPEGGRVLEYSLQGKNALYLEEAETGDLLFVKRFAVYPDRVYNEAAGLTISIWYPEDRRVELEPIGPRERLKPGESASFTEDWHLLAFPFPADRKQVDLQQLRQVVSKLPD
jgi:hypothetical protein